MPPIGTGPPVNGGPVRAGDSLPPNLDNRMTVQRGYVPPLSVPIARREDDTPLKPRGRNGFVKSGNLYL